MPTDIPIACTLPAAELPERLAEMRSIGQAALASTEMAGPEAVLRFRRDPDIRDRLQAIVEAESECCAFLHFDLSDSHDAIALAVRAPEGAEQVMQELVAAFRGEGAVAA